MGEDTSASYSGVTTTTVTETIGRPPRRTYFAIQLAVFGVTAGLFILSRSYAHVLTGPEMKDLPIPTDVLLALGKVITHPAGLAVGAAIILTLGLLALKGVLDSFLKFLIWLNVLWVIAVVAWMAYSFIVPLLKSPGPLSK